MIFSLKDKIIIIWKLTLSLVPTKEVYKPTYILGVGFDHNWYQLLEIRVYLVWWQLVIFIES